ncbi:MAG: hypothetical protein AAGK04_09370 [Planctomycetota bacterium]
MGERWLTLHQDEQSSHIVHVLPACHDNSDRRRFVSATEPLASLREPHLLQVEAYGFTPDARPWVITPYPGTHDGVLTLPSLAASKPQNRMEPSEVERAITHLFESVHACHEAGLHNGPIDPRQAIVDTRGSVLIEHYAYARTLAGLGNADANVVIDEIRSIVELAYALLTGVEAKAPLIPAGKLVRRLSPAWSRWLEQGLDPAGGFSTATEALGALPSRRPAGVETSVEGSRVRTVWTRVRRLTR